MPLIPVFSLSLPADNSALLLIADITGDYSALANPGGYGIPNATRESLYWSQRLEVKTKSASGFTSTVQILDASPLPASLYQSDIVIGGLFTLFSYSVSVFNPIATTYLVGRVLWNSTTLSYVRVTGFDQLGFPVTEPITSAQILPAEWQHTVETRVFHAFDINLFMARMLRALPATESCDMNEWMKRFDTVRIDSEAIKLLGCRKHYNNALILLARYQNRIYGDQC